MLVNVSVGLDSSYLYLFFDLYLIHVLVETENVFVFYTRVWDTRNMQPAFTFPAQQYFQVFSLLVE